MSNVLQPKDERAVARPFPWRVVVITALVAGVVGVLVGFVLSRSKDVPQESVVAATPAPPFVLRGASSDSLLSATLENGESGKAVDQGDRSAQVSLTFETEDGRYCRAFTSRDADAAAEGVACRDGTQWQIVAWDGTVDPDRSQQASGASELLDDVIDRLGGGAPLELADEVALIERHWSAPQ